MLSLSEQLTGALDRSIRLSRKGRVHADVVPRRRADVLAVMTVWTLIILYIALFAWQSIARHQALYSYAYDLGNVNQAFWNTVHGRPLYFTNWRGVELDLATNNRLAMHVEPIYFLLAPIYWLWQRPETILIIQTVFLALGAWPVYWLARDRIGSTLCGVVFAGIYLLFPALEAANLWEFHAVALAAPLLLFMFYYGQAGRWGRMWLCAILAMATKEEIPLTVALIGLYFAGWDVWRVWRQERTGAASSAPRRHGLRRFWTAQTANGLALVAVSAVWFIVAVQIIVPYFGGNHSPYLNYYGDLGDSSGKLLQSLVTQTGAMAAKFFTSRNFRYLFDLYTPVAFFSLLNPASLVFSFPDLFITLLSDHEPMHFVEKYHYVAPMLPGIMIAAILGVAWAARVISKWLRVAYRTVALLLTCTALLFTGYYHYFHGYTPLARAWESYKVSAHDRLVEQIAAMIPPDASVSAQANLNPHVSGRKTLYRFPYIGDADYVLLDLCTMFSDGWNTYTRTVLEGQDFGVVLAQDGYLLLRRGAPHTDPLPESLFSCMRADAAATPQYTADVKFGDVLRLVGFDVAWGRRTEMPQTPLRFRLYVQTIGQQDDDYSIVLYLLDENRKAIGSLDLQREPGTQYWYPIKEWPGGETFQLDFSAMPWWTAQYPRYSVALGVQKGLDTWDFAARVRPEVSAGSLTLPLAGDNTLVELLRFRTDAGGMPEITERGPLAAPPAGMTEQTAKWQNGIRLDGYMLETTDIHAGETLPVTLYWQTDRPIDAHYKVFVQLVGDGGAVAGYDAEPDEGGFPTALWSPGQVYPDRHPVQTPEDVKPGKYSVLVGLYDAATGQRVPLEGGSDAFTLVNHVSVKPH